MFKLVKKICLSNDGATAVEYGLILALVALSALIAIAGAANTTSNLWGDVADEATEASQH